PLTRFRRARGAAARLTLAIALQTKRVADSPAADNCASKHRAADAGPARCQGSRASALRTAAAETPWPGRGCPSAPPARTDETPPAPGPRDALRHCLRRRPKAAGRDADRRLRHEISPAM